MDKIRMDMIKMDKTYLLTFIYDGNIFKNNIEKLHNLENKMEELIIKKLEKYEPIKKINNIERDIYFSQIRDKSKNYEKIYTTEYNYISTIKIHYISYLFEILYKYHDKLTFPNLNKYHSSSKIEQKIFEINNIKIIIENSNIFIEFKNADINILNDIILIINTYGS